MCELYLFSNVSCIIYLFTCSKVLTIHCLAQNLREYNSPGAVSVELSNFILIKWVSFISNSLVDNIIMAKKYAIVSLLSTLIRIFLTLTYPLSDAILDYIYAFLMGKSRKLPPITNRILLMSAIELAEKIRKRQLSCEQVVKAYVERSKAVHSCINAVVDERYDDALKDAKEVDRFLASGKKSEEQIVKDTPLLGLPFSCKECVGVKGLSQTSGLVQAKGRKAQDHSPAPALYIKAGAIPLTVTDVPELLMFWESSNHLYGLTRNPYDNRRTVGGSTGGEAAVITSAGSLFGIGTDLAGSIRIPAAFCGIYGHKPSRGVVNNFGTYPFRHEKRAEKSATEEFSTTGPMCRYVQDLPLLLKILSDNDQKINLDHKVNFENVKVYFMEEIPGFLHAATWEVKNTIKKATKYFKEVYDINPTPLDIFEMEYSFQIWECKLLEAGSQSFMTFMMGKDGKTSLWWELFKNLFGCSDHTLPAIYYGMVDRRDKDAFYQKCLQKFQVLAKKMDQIFSQDAILLMPTHPEPPPHYLMTIPKLPNIAYTCIFNSLGFPVTQIPAGLSRKGLPVGVQIISGQYKDHLTLAAAKELDKVFGGWISPCPIQTL